MLPGNWRNTWKHSGLISSNITSLFSVSNGNIGRTKQFVIWDARLATKFTLNHYVLHLYVRKVPVIPQEWHLSRKNNTGTIQFVKHRPGKTHLKTLPTLRAAPILVSSALSQFTLRNTGLMHRAVCLCTPQLSQALAASTHGETARLSRPGWLHS